MRQEVIKENLSKSRRRSSLPQFVSRLLQRRSLTGLLLVLPAVAIAFAVHAYTLGYSIYLSVIEWSFGSSLGFVGLSQYVAVIRSPEFWQAIQLSAVYVGGIIASCFVLGLGLALLLEAVPFGAKVFRVLLFIPWIIPGFVAATILMWMVDPIYGVANHFLFKLGFISERVGWLGNPNTALVTVMAGVTWKAYPFLMLISLAALQSVPKELYDAVDVDGANVWQRFRFVTLPHLRSVLLTGSLLLFLMIANSMELLYIATQGGPVGATTILPVAAYNVAFKSWDFGQASVISMYMLLLLLVFITAGMRATLRRGE